MRKSIVFYALLMSLFLLGQAYAQPAAPSNLTAKYLQIHHFSCVTLTWNYSDDKRDIKFNIYRKSGAGEFEKLKGRTSLNLYVDKDIEQSMIYSYYVTAASRDSESYPSDTVTVNTGAANTEGLITGIITDEETGKFISDAKITLIPVSGFHVYNITSNDSGYFSKTIKSGDYYLRFSAKGYVSEFYKDANNIFDAEKITLNSDTVSISVVLKKAAIPVNYAISGKVKDTSGIALKAKVTAYILNSSLHRRKEVHASTDSAGAYSLQLNQGDSVAVYVQPKSRNYLSEFYNDKYEFAEADKFVVKGDMTIEFVLASKPVYANEISGNIYSNDSLMTPLQANITVFKIRDYSHGRNVKKTTMSDSLGQYSFSNIEPGSYIAFAVPMGKYLPLFYRADGEATMRWKLADTIVVSENSILNEINFRAVACPDSGYAHIRGHVNNSSVAGRNNSGVSGAIVYAADENGNTVNFAAADASGNYTLSLLNPGTYTLTVDKVSFSSTGQTTIEVDYVSNISASGDLILTPEFATSAGENNKAAVKNFALLQNYPNPFNPATVISYQLPKSGMVTIKVYNIIGQEIAVLVNEMKNAGQYNIKFDASNLPSGMYIYELRSGSFITAKKMMVVK